MKKKFIPFSIAIVTLLGSATVGFSNTYSRNITAWFENVKISIDGERLTTSEDAFFYNDRLYTPLEDVLKHFDLNYHYDQKAKTFEVLTGNIFELNPNDQLPPLIRKKDNELAILKAQVEGLEKELKSLKDSNLSGLNVTELDGERLQHALNKNLHQYSYLNFSYSVLAKRNDMDLVVYTNYNSFKNWSSDTKMRYLEAIRSQVHSINPQINLNGVIMNHNPGTDIFRFSLENNLISSFDLLSEIEAYLNQHMKRFTYGGNTFNFTYSLTVKDSSTLKLKLDGDFSIGDSRWKTVDTYGQASLQSFVRNALNHIERVWRVNIQSEVLDKNQELIRDDIGTHNSTLSPSSITFVKGSTTDLPIAMTLNGNTLNSIKNSSISLSLGTHYTVSGNTVFLKSSYLQSLSAGVHSLVFDFNSGVDPTLLVTIANSNGSNNTAIQLQSGYSLSYDSLFSQVNFTGKLNGRSDFTGLSIELYNDLMSQSLGTFSLTSTGDFALTASYSGVNLLWSYRIRDGQGHIVQDLAAIQ